MFLLLGHAYKLVMQTTSRSCKVEETYTAYSLYIGHACIYHIKTSDLHFISLVVLLYGNLTSKLMTGTYLNVHICAQTCSFVYGCVQIPHMKLILKSLLQK